MSLLQISQKITPGTYLVAVSGGVDSMVLLDILRHNNALHLIVAYFDHAIREDTYIDVETINKYCQKYQLKVIIGEIKSPATSESDLREARYQWLRQQQTKYQAQSIITAHHLDDVIETAVLNILRGTGRRGMTAILDNSTVVRPMLYVQKSLIRQYATDNKIPYHEDSTNSDMNYTRNRIRQQLSVIYHQSPASKKKLLEIILNIHRINQKLDQELEAFCRRLIHKGQPKISRYLYNQLDYQLSKELLHYILRKYKISDLDKKQIEYLVMKIKTAKQGNRFDINKHHYFEITKRSVVLITRYYPSTDN